MACVDIPAFPLQILLRKHPDWCGRPAAVVEEDRPQALLLWVNERARAARVLSGMRYAAGLSLARDLRAGVVPPSRIEEEVEAIVRRLRFFSPEVERSRRDPGTFWLGAEGLSLLHPSLLRWAEMIRDELAAQSYVARVAVGFSRFGSYAAARSGTGAGGGSAGRAGSGSGDEAAGGADHGAAGGIRIFRDSAEEQAAVRRIPIERIACAPDLRDALARLGIFELGGFLDLPPAGIRRRFGEEAYRLHRLAAGESWAPLQPEPEEVPVEGCVVFDQPESDTGRILQSIHEVLEDLLARLRRRDRALSALTVDLAYDRPGPEGERGRSERIRPAKPTRDPVLLLDLLRLRLESIALPAGVADLKVAVEWVAAGAEQMGLFAERPRRDREAADRALARVRAEFGDDSVCTARMREAHLPEARFALESMERLPEAQPRAVRMPPLVRRILFRPEPLRTSRVAECPHGLKISGADPGTVEEAIGPYVVSGGWWRREVIRRYWYVRLTSGAWLWIYHDARRRRWYRHGEVE